MTTAADLAAAVASHLSPALTPSLTSASHAFDLYEAYVFTLVLRGAEREKFAVTYETVVPGLPNVFTFRTSPGHIYTSTQPYSYAVLTSQNGLVLEAHVGVRLLGKSHVAHECDVLVLHRQEAVDCRANRVDPRHIHAEMAVECKFYAAGLDLGLLRGFVGLSADLARPVSTIVSNVTSTSMAQFFKAHKRLWEDHLTPGSSAEERFVGDVRSALHRFQST